MPTLESARAAEAAFLEDVCRHPGDNAPRLIYADWLDEHGQAERAEFIRVQCELAGFYPAAKDWGRKGTAERYEALRRREWELLGRTAAMTTRQVFEPEYGWLPEPVRYLFETGPRDGRHDRFWEWRRGFIEEITLPASGFVEHAAALFRAAPLGRVTLDEREPTDALRPGQFWWWVVNEAHLNHLTACDLPRRLWDLLSGGEKPPHTLGRRYDSREEAEADLAAACLLYGRRAAWPCPECGGKGGAQSWDGMGGWWDVECTACRGRGHMVQEG
jgi:uncharacterized protein (TIGR02996 family)